MISLKVLCSAAAIALLAVGSLGNPPVYPVVLFEDLQPVVSTIVADASGPPGSVVTQAEDGDAGRYRAQVEMVRDGYTMLRVAYHPRMRATVDGVKQSTVMIAPAFVGVRVPVGTHQVVFAYAPYPNYAALFAIGGLAVAVLVVFDRRWRGRWLAPIIAPPLFPERAFDELPAGLDGCGETPDVVEVDVDLSRHAD